MVSSPEPAVRLMSFSSVVTFRLPVNADASMVASIVRSSLVPATKSTALEIVRS